ncbi:hypothetical protein BC834DRAFT_842430 [Gloeopeniophorella convolvens]|nr:hypothetical protein BC834DRAFT_842430 [Gloeopeniophorella convolvens]
MLGDLGSPRFSALISLFGTISMSSPPARYESPLAQHVDSGTSRGWWGFVFQMVRDKKRIVGGLIESDLYWLVTSKAAEAGLDIGVIYTGEDATSPRLATAREQFLYIDTRTAPADEYVPYLKALLSLKNPGGAREAAAWLCYLAKRDIYCPPSLLGVLWSLVLNNKTPPDDVKQEILSVLSQRLTLPVDFTKDARKRFASLPPEPALDPDTPEQHPSFCLTASDLAHQVTRILFPRVAPSQSGTPSQLAIQEWAHSETQRMFSPTARIEFRWRNLVYLALANSSSPPNSPAAMSALKGLGEARLSAADFGLVAIIVLFERITNTPSVPPNWHHFIRSLWTSWANIIHNDANTHRALIRPLLGTFFRLAAVTRDASLVGSCVRLASVGFWQFDLGDDAARRQVQLLAIEYLATAVLSGDAVWERIIAELPPHVVFPQWHPMLLAKTILRLVRLDAQRAVDVYHVWRRYLPVPDLSASLGPMLVEEGHTDLAMPILATVDFTGTSLGAVFRPLAKQGAWYIDLELASILAKALLAVSASESPLQTTNARRYISWALLALVCSAQAPAAVAVFKNVRAWAPGFFNGRTVRAFLVALLHHRQFRSAVEVAMLSPNKRWRRFVQHGLLQRGEAPRAMRQLGLPTSRAWLHGALQHPRFSHGQRHCPAQANLRTRHWLARRVRTPAEVRRGMRALTRTRGVGLARRILRDVRALHDAGTRTALGNIVLHGHAAQRHGARGVLRALAQLVHGHAFAPDRVTTNIVVGAALRAPGLVDAARVRALVDYFVWRGYPGRTAGGGVPFGTGEARARDAAVLHGVRVPVPRSQLSFARHVEPLYKLFVKALFVRGDVAGARRVVGLLKEAERAEAERVRQLRRARST